MSLLIDGYNLLHATGILGRGIGPGGLQRARLAMLNFLAESLDPPEVPRTSVVFDAREAPWGLPRVLDHRGITVRFAAEQEDADALIEELIRRESAPRRLTVVSSDHRLQRAARHRRAAAVDSDVWYAEILRRRQKRLRTVPQTGPRSYVPLLDEDVDYWIHQFGGESLLKDFFEQETRALGAATQEAPDDEAEGAPPDDAAAEKPQTADEIDNPFPPGYAEDLLEDDSPGDE
jgi:predicted RNA-binding protein with PIN domain